MKNPPGELKPVHDQGRLSYAIFQLARAHRAYAAQLLRELNLHPGQELLLMQLLERDGQTQSELLAAAGLDHSTVSKSLRRMQAAGLLTREPAEHDRRVLRVRLTNQGRALRGGLEAMWATLEGASVGDLGADTVREFIATCEVIRQAVVDHNTPSSAADKPKLTGDEGAS